MDHLQWHHNGVVNEQRMLYVHSTRVDTKRDVMVALQLHTPDQTTSYKMDYKNIGRSQLMTAIRIRVSVAKQSSQKVRCHMTALLIDAILDSPNYCRNSNMQVIKQGALDKECGGATEGFKRNPPPSSSTSAGRLRKESAPALGVQEAPEPPCSSKPPSPAAWCKAPAAQGRAAAALWKGPRSRIE